MTNMKETYEYRERQKNRQMQERHQYNPITIFLRRRRHYTEKLQSKALLLSELLTE